MSTADKHETVAEQAELRHRHVLHVDAAVFDAVLDLLSEPAKRHEKLKKLMKSMPQWLD